MKKSLKVAISMPAYNEQEGIVDFIEEINDSLDNFDIRFFIVDDCSTDGTLEVLKTLKDNESKYISLSLDSNLSNKGHGPTFLRAVINASEWDFDYLITTDGDGKFCGSDFEKILNFAIIHDSSIVEGVRTHRSDPFFRKVITVFTRALVFIKCRNFPKDANTPLRVYKRDVVKFIFGQIEEDAITPNLRISVICRRERLEILEIKVKSRARRGLNTTGTMWKSASKFYPSKRFIKFCILAFVSYLNY